MRGYFQQVDATLIQETLYDPSLTGMGTTLTVAYSVGNHAFVVHAGDSRPYLLRDGMFRQLTRDHTLAQSLADAGKIPAESVSGIRPDTSWSISPAVRDGESSPRSAPSS